MIQEDLEHIVESDTWEIWYSGPFVNEKVTNPSVCSTSSASEAKRGINKGKDDWAL